MVEEYNKFITCDDAERVALDTLHYRDGAVGESSEEMLRRSSPLAQSQKDRVISSAGAPVTARSILVRKAGLFTYRGSVPRGAPNNGGNTYLSVRNIP